MEIELKNIGEIMVSVLQQEKRKKEIVLPENYNAVFGVLSAFAIIMIVAGHLGYSILTVGELFPYYSFHVPLFMFISGYFYREKEEERPFRYIKKKVFRLLLPYFAWNLVYGLIAWGFRAWGGFGMGEGISFRTLFLEPFLSGYQFIYNYASWFVPVLFVIEMLNLVMRLILKRLHLCSEWLIIVCSLAVGMIVVQLSIGGHVWGYYKMPGKILFLYPCFQMGQLYYRKLEKQDTLPNLPYFCIVVGVQVILNLTCGGLAYSSVWCTGFANGPAIPYVTAVSGIAFWLRLAKVLSPVLKKSKSVVYLGRNTFAVMMHHVMAFMLVKVLLAEIALHTGFFADFDFLRFYADIDYYYLVKGTEAFKMVYLAAGIAFPLCLQKGIDWLKMQFAEKNAKAEKRLKAEEKNG